MTASDFWRSPLDPERVINTRVTHWQGDAQEQREEYLTVEEPLELRLAGRSLAVIMRTPGHDSELAAGFLLTEGIIQQGSDLLTLQEAVDDEGIPLVNVIEVTLNPSSPASSLAQDYQRSFPVSSSCGFCGKDSMASALCAGSPITQDTFHISHSLLYELPPHLRAAQDVFTHTGGLHAAGLFDAQGSLLALREDAGRHNAVDKLIGYGVLHAVLPYSNHLLLVSGRTSFEIIQKAFRARIPCIAAISAPSSLAVELADRCGITLIGFLRERTCNVYTHPERIV